MQHEDGGWGERCNTYDDPVFKGQGPSTASQTAWAVMGLCAFGDPDLPSLKRGIDYLVRTQQPDGSWAELETTGTGFPQGVLSEIRHVSERLAVAGPGHIPQRAHRRDESSERPWAYGCPGPRRTLAGDCLGGSASIASILMPSASPNPVAPVLVCFAVPEEAKFFRPMLEKGSAVEVLITGIGPVNAAACVEASLARQRPARVWTCGFAGGLKLAMPAGTLLFSEDDSSSLSVALRALGAVPGKFHCAQRIATTAAEKRALWTQTGAEAVEMESGIIAQICRQRGIPCVTLRVISDGADQDLPLDFNALLDERYALNYGKLAWALLRAPGRIGGLMRLQKETQRGARELARVLQQLLFGRPSPGAGVDDLSRVRG